MKKIDMFAAKREFADRVAKFVDLKVLRAQYAEEYRIQVSATKKLIASLDTLKNTMSADTIPTKKAQYESDLEEFESAYAEKLEKMEKFDLTAEEKALKKALRPLGCDDTTAIKKALADFFKNYELDIKGTDLEKSLLNALGGKVDMRKFVKSEGTDGVSLASGTALNLIFWVTFNYMVSAGTIGAAKIPECLKAKYIKADGKVDKEVAKAQK